LFNTQIPKVLGRLSTDLFLMHVKCLASWQEPQIKKSLTSFS
jgi:hypothetical protein